MTSRNEAHEIDKTETFRVEFHRLLGRLVHQTAQFDFNIGLQLNSFSIYYQLDLGDLLDPIKSQLGQRLKKLQQVTMKAYERAGEQALAEFSEWFDQANDLRALRNDYVHGRWGVPGNYKFIPPGRLLDAEPLLTFVPLNWDMSPDQPDKAITMTLHEFSQQVEAAEMLFANHRRLRKKYEQFTKLGSEGLN